MQSGNLSRLDVRHFQHFAMSYLDNSAKKHQSIMEISRFTIMNELFTDIEVKVLLAMDETSVATKLVNYLADEGIFCRAARNADELKELIRSWKPDFIVIDLLYTELNALMLLKSMRQNETSVSRKNTKVFVTSQHHNNISNVKECLRWGASDYLIMPLKHVDVLSRIIFHVQEKREIKDFNEKDILQVTNEAQYYIHLTDLTLKEAIKGSPLDLSLHNLTKMVAIAMKAVRVSIVECDADTRVGIVHGSSDNRDVKQLKLTLDKYPEILYTINSNKILAIDNLEKDPTMKALGAQSKSINFRSMIVAPIETPRGVWGVISARMPETRGRFEDIEIQFVQLVSHVISLVVQKNDLLEQVQKAS